MWVSPFVGRHVGVTFCGTSCGCHLLWDVMWVSPFVGRHVGVICRGTSRVMSHGCHVLCDQTVCAVQYSSTACLVVALLAVWELQMLCVSVLHVRVVVARTHFKHYCIQHEDMLSLQTPLHSTRGHALTSNTTAFNTRTCSHFKHYCIQHEDMLIQMTLVHMLHKMVA